MYVASALLILIGLPLIAVGNQSIKQRRLVLIDKYNNTILPLLMNESSDRRSTTSSIDHTDTTNTTTARTSRSLLAKQLCLNVTNDDDDDINDNNNNNNSSSGIYDLTQPLLNNNILDISSASSNFTDVSPNPDDDDYNHYSLIRGNDVWENITLSRENSIVDSSSNPDDSSSSSSSHYYMQSLWSRCSLRNALLMSLQVMIYARMITVTYTPRSEPRHYHRHHHRSSVNEIVVDDDKVAQTAVHPGDADGSGCDGINGNVILHRHSNNSSSQLEPVIMSHSSALE